MTKQRGRPVLRNGSLALHLLQLSLLHQYKIGKLKTIDSNINIIFYLHICLAVSSKEEAGSRIETCL